MKDRLYHTNHWKAHDWLVIDEMTRQRCCGVVVHIDIDCKAKRNDRNIQYSEHVGIRYSMF